ncbi:MAG: hypothetical protein WAV26_11075 [Candidatus Deferrimicrobium sp.]
MEAACTIASFNYLPQIRTFAHSFKRYNPNINIFVLLVDDGRTYEDFSNEPFDVILAKDLDLEDFLLIAFKFNIIELNTALKPSFIKFLFNKKNVGKLLYFDPDILVFAPLDPLFEELNRHSVLLTPHILAPGTALAILPDTAFLRFGVFNLGFIGMRLTHGTSRLLDWWERQCLYHGNIDVTEGIFVDQKWINLFPCFSDDIGILRLPGCNMAYWNLHERKLNKSVDGWLVNDSSRLMFFHFSNLDPLDKEGIMKSLGKPTLKEREDLREIFSGYREQLHRHGCNEEKPIRYHYDYYSNGLPIGGLARRMVGSAFEKFRGENPFDSSGNVYRWIMSNNLNGAAKKTKTNPESHRTRAKISILDGCLRAAFRLLGADNYQNLLYYLQENSTFSRQSKILKL